MGFRGFRLWALGFGLCASFVAPFQADAAQIKAIRPPRIPAVLPVLANLPRRDAPIRVAVLRVEFARDTLSTTTGDGSFDYGSNDTNYFDPPPHDSLYFADMLQFQQFYWDKMSNGSVGLEWKIFPAGAQAAYQLPKQIWQYNHNNGDAQLDHGLAELFRDAVVAADVDQAIIWQHYDLVMIFHAGAGAEFDLGYSTTPHDIPSAWMVPDDFRSQLNLPNGIPVDGGTRFVDNGIILPETETHEGVQISVAGVITLMIGHWMGLPALYDKDDGKAVVGKWSMMDRGFGNFYGALPGPVDAWSAGEMGWLDPVLAEPDTLNICARFQPLNIDSLEHRYPFSYAIPISDQEEFILECRQRDPEGDSVAYAYDRNGKRMTLHDDYSVTVEPGFRVPVYAEDLDFDSPGSGILIWHHDKGLDNLIPDGRFNSVNGVRGLDLEEADGAQDIGQDYPLLTAGYGTDYGIYEDAWYGDNTAAKNANGGRQVSFNDNSYPDSRSNSGAFTHIRLDQFSRRGGVMNFRYGQSGVIFKVAPPDFRGVVITGHFSDEVDSGNLALFSLDSVHIYNSGGVQAAAYPIQQGSYPVVDGVLCRDINGDGRDDLIWIGNNHRSLDGLISHPFLGYVFTPIDSIPEGFIRNIAFGGEGLGSVLAVLSSSYNSLIGRRYHSGLQLQHEIAIDNGNELPPFFARAGSSASDSFFVVTNKASLYLWTRGGIQLVQSTPARLTSADAFSIFSICVADFDASGMQDVGLSGTIDETGNFQSIFVRFTDPLADNPIPAQFQASNWSVFVAPVDLDFDGRFDLFGARAEANGMVELVGANQNMTLLDGYPQPLQTTLLPTGLFGIDAILKLIPNERLTILSTAKGVTALKSDGTALGGFPIATDRPVSVSVAELDTIPGYDLLVASDHGVTAYSLPTSQWPNQSIWQQGPYRDNDNSNAVWEPATPFSPAPSAPLMPSDLCYNWPNPASESTAIRFTLNFAATVTVTIFDIAGDKVTTLHGVGQAGVPNEIIWNLKDVARGGYLAVVEANGAGRSEKKTVKIAVKK